MAQKQEVIEQNQDSIRDIINFKFIIKENIQILTNEQEELESKVKKFESKIVNDFKEIFIETQKNLQMEEIVKQQKASIEAMNKIKSKLSAKFEQLKYQKDQFYQRLQLI